jgi:hypothetical protein
MPLRAGWVRRPYPVAFHDYPRPGHVSYAERLPDVHARADRWRREMIFPVQ